MRHLIDPSKLPAPQLIEELDYEKILTEMRMKLRELLPEWTGYELESDPANKVLEVAAYREMLLRQRVNEAARGVLVAFAQSSDLDHLAAFYPEKRLSGALATFAGKLTLAAPLGMDVTIPADYRIVAKNGAVEARLMGDVTIPKGETTGSERFEIVRPAGMDANGLSYAQSWEAINPLPFVVKVEQTEVSSGGSDPESDEAFRQRIPTALERYSTAGPRRAYEYWAYTSDPRVVDALALSPQPGDVKVVLLSGDGDGTADEAMIRRAAEILSADDVRPLTDHVEVISARILKYRVRVSLEVYSGVAGTEPIAEATRRLGQTTQELFRIGLDVPISRFIAAGHVSGVKKVHILEPESDIRVSDEEAAYCIGMEVASFVAPEP